MAAAAIQPASAAGERQYHNTASPYVLPNDVVEQERLDAQAAAITEMIGGSPFLALKNSGNSMGGLSAAVDVGCGTGIATLQLANLFPSARVYGLDLSPVPPMAQRMAPANVTWATGNALDVDCDADGAGAEPSDVAHIFQPQGLGYVFGRMLFLGMDDWVRYFRTATRALRPGGIIEHQDLDWDFYRVASGPRLSHAWEWHRCVTAAAETAGLSVRAGSSAAELMRKQGLEVLSVQTFEFSFCPSAKVPNSQAMGRYVQAKLIPQYPELLRKMLGSRGMAGEELERMTQQCLRDLASEEGVHQKYTVTVARKPY